MKFSADKIVARNELAVKKGQLSYLKNLAKVIAVDGWIYTIIYLYYTEITE